MNIVLGVIAVLVYVWVAKRYRYRERHEPFNIHLTASSYTNYKKRTRYRAHSETSDKDPPRKGQPDALLVPFPIAVVHF